MKIYRIQITGDRYPTDYYVKASSWATAIARGVREWKKRFKGAKTNKLRIVAVKGGPLLQEEETRQ
jgi:hypothetical protein